MKIENKLQEIIDKHSPNPNDTNFYHFSDVLSIAEEAYNLGVPRWVPIEERLPEYGEDFNVVLALKDGGSPVSGIMEFDGIKRIWNYPGTDVECTDVTHWMSLPLPPSPNK